MVERIPVIRYAPTQGLLALLHLLRYGFPGRSFNRQLRSCLLYESCRAPEHPRPYPSALHVRDDRPSAGFDATSVNDGKNQLNRTALLCICRWGLKSPSCGLIRTIKRLLCRPVKLIFVTSPYWSKIILLSSFPLPYRFDIFSDSVYIINQTLKIWLRSSAGERLLDMQEVGGSKPLGVIIWKCPGIFPGHFFILYRIQRASSHTGADHRL